MIKDNVKAITKEEIPVAIPINSNRVYLYGFALFTSVIYIISQSLLITSGFVCLYVLYYFYTKDDKYLITNEKIIQLKRKKLTEIKYSSVEYAKFYKPAKSFSFVVMSIHYQAPRKIEKLNIEIPTSENAITIIKTLRSNEVQYSYSDDYTEMIIEHIVNIDK